MKAAAGHSRYSSVAIALHWIIGLIIIANLIGGLTLDYFLDSPDPAMKQLGFTIIGLHKSFGLTVILLTLARIGWRIANPPPPLPAHMTRAEITLSKVSHYGFYVMMLAMPLSGWAMTSTGKVQYPLLYFGLFEVPKLPLPKSLGGLFHESHEIIGYLVIATLALHIAAVIKHHYFDRDNIWARMSPFGGKDAA